MALSRPTSLLCRLALAGALALAGCSESTPDEGPEDVPDAGADAGVRDLEGELRGPVGAEVVLQLDGAGARTVTIPPFPGGTDLYSSQPFTLGPLPDGVPYAVTVQRAPPGQLCTVYKGASGTTPVAAGALKVGCEWKADLASRSANDSVRGTFYDSTSPVTGGHSSQAMRSMGEGRFVAFVSSAALGGGAGGARQVFLRDRLEGRTYLLSASPAGVPGNADSRAPAISADGLTVVFESSASNLVDGDANGVSDVFVWSAASGSIPDSVKRVSLGAGGVEANGPSSEPTVSADGSVVAFSSSASNLTAGVSGTSTVNVYRRVVATGATTLVTQADGTGVGGARPSLSWDGNRLAFWSFAANLVSGDTNGLWDIFVYRHDTGALTRVSLTESGGERDQGAESASRIVAPTLSGSGRYVAYATTAANVVAGDTNGAQDVFLVDLEATSGRVRRLSRTPDGVQGNGDSPVGQGERIALSWDGALAAFSTKAANLTGGGTTALVLHAVGTGETRRLDTSTAGVGPPHLSPTGAYVVSGSGAQEDGRFASTGLFSFYTGASRPFFWVD